LAELNREKFGASIREYWTEYQNELIANQKEMDKKVLELYAQDPQKAAEYTTKQGIDIADTAIKNAKILYEELMTELKKQNITAQMLLQPLLLKLTEREKEIIIK